MANTEETMDPTIESVPLTLEDVQQALDAMLWVINPYLDYDSLTDYPYIIELALAYNSMVVKIPAWYKHSYPLLSIS